MLTSGAFEVAAEFFADSPAEGVAFLDLVSTLGKLDPGTNFSRGQGLANRVAVTTPAQAQEAQSVMDRNMDHDHPELTYVVAT